MQNRPKDLWIGGDMIQLEKTKEALERKGIDVEFNSDQIYPFPLRYRNFDIIHLFNFSMSWTKVQFYLAKKWKKPVIISMIYHEGEKFVSYQHQQIMADNADALIFLTEGELKRAKKHITIDETKVHFIENGIEPFWFSQVNTLNQMEDYILTVGRIDYDKGQLETAKACKKLGLKYVMVGEKMNTEYGALCEAFGALHIPPQEPENLIKLYSKCKAYVLASKAEIMPLTVMEVGAQGVPIVLTDKCEWEGLPDMERCKPEAESIAEAITKAIKKPKSEKNITHLKSMTWDNVADKVLSIYQNI